MKFVPANIRLPDLPPVPKKNYEYQVGDWIKGYASGGLGITILVCGRVVKRKEDSDGDVLYLVEEDDGTRQWLSAKSMHLYIGFSWTTLDHKKLRSMYDDDKDD